MKCVICEMWSIDREAKWIGKWGDGKAFLMCHSCRSQGAGRGKGFTPIPFVYAPVNS